PKPRCPPIGFGDALPFKAKPQVKRQLLCDVQMILPEKVCLQVGTVERAAAGKSDTLQQATLRIHDIDRARGEFASVGRARDDTAELQIVRAREIVNRPER